MTETTVLSPQITTLYEQLGGAAAVNAAVEVFYRKILSDSRIAPFFDGMDINRLIAMQTAFLTMAFGGPHNYTGADLRRAHRHLVTRGLNDSHFDAVIELLGQSLAELGVSPSLVTHVTGIAESTRNDVLNR